MDFFERNLIHEVTAPAYEKSTTTEPDLNVYDLGDKFIVKIEMPATKDIKMEMRRGELYITGKKRISCDSINPTLEECKDYDFERGLTLPYGSVLEDISTEYIDGIFIMHVPKI